jgi:putative nucleotidyltransferase with HDIG domain
VNINNISSTVDSDETQRELEKRGWALSALSEAAASLARADSKDLLIQEVCTAIASQGPYILAWVGTAEDDATKTVKVLGGAGSALDYISNLSVSWAENSPSGLGPAEMCIRTGKPNVVADTELDSNFVSWRESARQFEIRSVIGCPIPDGAMHPYGCLLVYSKIPNAFSATEVQLFQSLAHEIGFGLRSIERQHQLDKQIHENELAQERLSGALRSTIEAMSKTMEWRDPYTAGHQKRVALISMAIARQMGLANDDIQALYMAAMVHDIGKVAVPSEILTKPTRLTSLEMQVVQEHAETGYQILKDIPFPWPIADMVHQHHERMDGSGYPQGLKDNQICLEAKILAVADTLEAMATHRPYRPARGLAAAMDELRLEAGIKLDQKVVDAAFSLMHADDELQKLILAD